MERSGILQSALTLWDLSIRGAGEWGGGEIPVLAVKVCRIDLYYTSSSMWHVRHVWCDSERSLISLLINTGAILFSCPELPPTSGPQGTEYHQQFTQGADFSLYVVPVTFFLFSFFLLLSVQCENLQNLQVKLAYLCRSIGGSGRNIQVKVGLTSLNYL